MTGTDWSIITDNIPPDSLSYEARNLKPAKTYEFIVTAVNSVGEGQWSAPTAALTIDPEGWSCFSVFLDVRKPTVLQLHACSFKPAVIYGP